MRSFTTAGSREAAERLLFRQQQHSLFGVKHTPPSYGQACDAEHSAGEVGSERQHAPAARQLEPQAKGVLDGQVVKVALPEGPLSGLPVIRATADTRYRVAGWQPGMWQVAVGAATAQVGTPDRQALGLASSQTVSTYEAQLPVGGGATTTNASVELITSVDLIVGPLQRMEATATIMCSQAAGEAPCSSQQQPGTNARQAQCQQPQPRSWQRWQASHSPVPGRSKVGGAAGQADDTSLVGCRGGGSILCFGPKAGGRR